jgi:hypothetical protein
MIKSTLIAIHIWWLKRKAKKHYVAYYERTSEYDCGWALAEELGFPGNRHALAFDETMDKLAKLDQDTPKMRLLD